mgnify:CR=1 FL=1
MERLNIMNKRKWVYTQPPKTYEMSPCSCGNEDTEWSEYEKHLWCSKCEKDFIPEHIGIFDGPILLQVANLCGIRFDRWMIEEDKIVTQEEYTASLQD